MNRPRERNERGAILVLTAIAMILLMAFTAVAIDLGQRDQQLAGAQHSIDSATLAAAQFLSTHDGDYAGAAARVKEIIRENLGIEVAAWADCTDALHLEIFATNDTNCISFRRVTNASGTGVKHDIRVTLPHYSMNTIFGSVLGVDTIDLSAAASSNGNNCGGAVGCGPGTTVPPDTTPTTTAAPPTLEEQCSWYTYFDYALTDWVWDLCQKFSEGMDRITVQADLCNATTYTYSWRGQKATQVIDDPYRYLWYWGVCSNYLSASSRTSWLRGYCTGMPTAEIYWSWTTWSVCREVLPSLQDWDAYYATTTTQKPSPTTTAAPPLPTTPPTSVPTSIDLSG